METLGFYARKPSWNDDIIPVSRDYKLIVPCEMENCPINKSKHCSMASAIKISSGGYCQTGRDLIKTDLYNKSPNKKVDGD